MTAAVPIRSDPLATAADRLPMAWPRSAQFPGAQSCPSSVDIRPFGLRFVVAIPQRTVPLPQWHYCPERQIAVGVDGRPWRELVDMTMDTTGPSPDGGGSTGNEEWKPDFMSDEID